MIFFILSLSVCLITGNDVYKTLRDRTSCPIFYRPPLLHVSPRRCRPLFRSSIFECIWHDTCKKIYLFTFFLRSLQTFNEYMEIRSYFFKINRFILRIRDCNLSLLKVYTFGVRCTNFPFTSSLSSSDSPSVVN